MGLRCFGLKISAEKTGDNMEFRSEKIRKLKNISVVIIAFLTSIIGMFFLAWILFTVFKRGFSAIDLDFFTKISLPPGVKGGGLANAMVGTLEITVVATLISTPIGILAGIYLSEFAKGSFIAGIIEFSINIFMSIPSIILGLFVWGTVVVVSGGFSGYAGALSLSLIMIPVITNTTKDMMNLIPNNLREAVFAVGVPKWRSMYILFLASKKGLITGILLSMARVSGETAPLLFTALNSSFWPSNFSKPVANLPVTIFNYAMSPYHDWQAKAWGASLVITVFILTISILVRTIFVKKTKRG